MIRNDSPTRQDDRAVSVAVTHVLAIGITTILIVGLLTAAGGLAEDEQERSAREQLQMIGSSMANGIEQADDLGRQGANVSVRKEFEGTVSGKSYTVDFETGSECDAATIDSEACLVLDLSNSDVSATVGVSNRSAVTFEHLGSGTVRIVSEPGGTVGDAPYDPTILEQIGVGGSVYDLPPGTGSLAELNKPPIARFTIDPGAPQYNDTIILNASGSSDPEANISKYIWNFTGGPNAGLFNQTTENATIAVPTGDVPGVSTLKAGRYTVELSVVDPVGNKGESSEFVKISGLEYLGDAKAGDFAKDGDPQGVNFTLENKHSNVVHVTEVYVNPKEDPISGDINELSDGRFGDGMHEVVINDSIDSEILGYFDQSGIEIVEGGAIIKKYEWDDYPDIPEIDGEKQAIMYFKEFRNGDDFTMAGISTEVSIRYYVDPIGSDKVYYSTQINMTPESPYLDRDNPSTFNQHWNDGSGGHTIKARFDNLENNPDAEAEVLVASGELGRYDWKDDTASPHLEDPQTTGGNLVKVKADLTSVTLTEPEYIVVEVRVDNDNGTQVRRYYIEIVP